LKNKKEAVKFENFLEKAQIKVFLIDNKICQKAYELFRNYFYSHHLGIADALIAATAMINNKKLITANIKHFTGIKNLKKQKFN